MNAPSSAGGRLPQPQRPGEADAQRLSGRAADLLQLHLADLQPQELLQLRPDGQSILRPRAEGAALDRGPATGQPALQRTHGDQRLGEGPPLCVTEKNTRYIYTCGGVDP